MSQYMQIRSRHISPYLYIFGMYSVYFWQVLWYVLVRSEKLAHIWHVFLAQKIYVPFTYPNLTKYVLA